MQTGEAGRAYRRAYYAAHKEQCLAYARTYIARHPAKAAAYERHRQGQPEPLYAAPGYCECCGTVDPGKGRKRWQLDHCHKTGKFRGWLCQKCNVGIGLLGDTMSMLNNAVTYLSRTA